MKYENFKYKETILGVKEWRNPKNKFYVFMPHYSSDPMKDPNREGKEWYEAERRGFPKALWDKEYEIDFTTKSGKLIFGKEYCDFDENIHFVDSFDIKEPTENLISLDFGQRNPTAGLVAKWTMDGVLYIIDEYYKPALPSQSSREMFIKFSYLFNLTKDINYLSMDDKRQAVYNTFQIPVIDPTTVSKNRSKVVDGEEIPYSVIEEFYDNGWDFMPGINDVTAGITKIREFMRVTNGKTRLYIFRDKCPNLCKELVNYRYKEYTDVQGRSRNDSEEPIKKNDHCQDSLRYLIQTRPIEPVIPEREKTRIEKDIERLCKPKASIVDAWDND